MSLTKHLLNPWLRLIEKPRLARATPEEMRRRFTRLAKLSFWPPRGTRYSLTEMHHAGQALPALTVNAAASGPLLLYFHGGGYVFGSPETHKSMLATLSKLCDCPAILPRYRLAPEHTFPAAPEDALHAYHAVMDHPGGVVLGGDSAGGGLALALLGEITRLGLPQPLGTFVLSPLTDLRFCAPSLRDNASSDVVLPAARTGEFAQTYLQGANPDDPRGSPIHAGFKGAGPVRFAVSDSEILLDDSTRMAERLRAQGVTVSFDLQHDLPHAWPLFHNILPEARATLRDIAGWITTLSPPTPDS